MSGKQPDPIQFAFDFGDINRYCVYCAYPSAYDSHVVAFARAKAAAMTACAHAASSEIQEQSASAPVFSIADRLARRQQAYDDMLYESILARIKHLPF